MGNALAAAGAALALGLPLADIAAGLSAAAPRSRWRMELHERADGVTVINDAYNANPDSMHAAVDTLAELGRGGARRTWAVLGDMLELGETAPEAHAALGRFVAERGIDRLVAVGDVRRDDGRRGPGRGALGAGRGHASVRTRPGPSSGCGPVSGPATSSWSRPRVA